MKKAIEQANISSEIAEKEVILKLVLKRKNAQHSVLLDVFRQCNYCPLGEQKKKVIIKDEEKIITKQAICPLYEKDKIDCPFGKFKYINLLKEFYQIVSTKDYEEELAKYLMDNILSDAIISRDIETIKEGSPGVLTNKHMETAVKLFDSIVKLRTGSEKHLHIHDENIADKIINSVFEKKEATNEGSGTLPAT